MAMVAALMTLLIRMTWRKPKRAMTPRPSIFIDIEPAAVAKVMLPDAAADRPNTS